MNRPAPPRRGPGAPSTAPPNPQEQGEASAKPQPSDARPPSKAGEDRAGRNNARRSKARADVLLVAQGLVPTRTQAQAVVLAGDVYWGERRVDKPGALLPSDAALTVRARQKYVSRGGLKLEGALQDLSFDPKGAMVADIGASTGGFTDCLLQHGAAHVYAIDVGHGQLAHKLVGDERVTVLDRTNARHLQPKHVGGGVNLVVVDASFISLQTLLPAIRASLLPGGHLIALVKPQFEVGRTEAQRGKGVVRDPKVRQRAIRGVIAGVEAVGLELLGESPCRVPGPKGNIEHFVLARAPGSRAPEPRREQEPPTGC